MNPFHVPGESWQIAEVSFCIAGSAALGVFCPVSPTHTPPPLSRPAGRKRGATSGRVSKALQCLIGRRLNSAINWNLTPIKSWANKFASTSCRQVFHVKLAFTQLESPQQNWTLTPIKSIRPKRIQRAVERVLQNLRNKAKCGGWLPSSPRRGAERGGGVRGGQLQKLHEPPSPRAKLLMLQISELSELAARAVEAKKLMKPEAVQRIVAACGEVAR
jgi:hypothetical protein